MKKTLCAFITLFLTIAVLSCGKKQENDTDLVTFRLRGRVVEIDTADKVVTIAHEEIPNYMHAMTMPFKVRRPELLRGVEPGDSVYATLAVTRVASWLETLTVLAPGVTPKFLTPEEILEKMIKPGEMFPDAQLLDQEGRSFRISSFRGKVLAITFVYTRCPLPDYCMRMSTNFAALQKELSADPSLAGKWHLLTVSFDAAMDRPNVMKQYGISYAADFSTWTFATDPDTGGSTIVPLADGLGLMYASDQGQFNHNLRTALVDADGKLATVIKGNAWTAQEVAREIREIAGRH